MRNQGGRVVLMGVFLYSAIVGVMGCSGGGGSGGDLSGGDSSGVTTSTPTDKSVPSIDITGSIESDSVTTSASKGTTKSLSAKSASGELICEGFTSDGDTLGSAEVDTGGQYLLAAPLAALKPTDASGATWNAKFFIKCADKSGKRDIRNYCESKVEEGKTTSIVCHATPETTLATVDLLTKSGCQIGAACAVSDVDSLCFIELQTAVYEAAQSSESSTVKDEIAAVLDLANQCMSEEGYSALGFPSASAMIAAILDGSFSDAQADHCGVSSELRKKYTSGASKIITQLRDIFYTSYAGDKSKDSNSPCALTKSDRNFAKKLVATYALADSADALDKMKASEIKESVVKDLVQHCSGGSCDHEKIKPELVIEKVRTKIAPTSVHIVEAPKVTAPTSNPVTQVLQKIESKPAPKVEKIEQKVDPKVEQKVEPVAVTKVEPKPVEEKRVTEEKKAEVKKEEKQVAEDKKVEEEKDTTPPDLYSVYPGFSRYNVGLTTPVTIVFRETLDSRTLNSNTFYVANKDGNKVAGKIKYEPEKHTLTFAPDGYQSLSPYTIVLTTGIKDLAGNALREMFTTTFNTGSEPPYGLITTAGVKSAKVSWTELPGANFYNLYYSTSPDITTKTGTKIEKIKGTSYTVPKLNEATYYFLLTANHTAEKYETEASSKVQETPMGFSVETIASKIGDVNQNIHSAMAMDSNGKVHIVYSDSSGGKNSDLAYATNASGRWEHRIIDGGDFVGEYSSVAVDSDNHVHVSYYGGNESSLKYATNAPSGKWTVKTIDSARNKTFGQFTSIALDSTSVHIAYWDMSNGDLRYASNRNGSWEKYIVDNGNGDYGLPKSSLLGLYTDIAVDAGGTIHISYYDDANGDLKYARKDVDRAWLIETVDADGRVGVGTDLAIDGSLNVYIAYKDSSSDSLKLGKRINGKWEVITIEGGGVGYEPSIDIDSRGRLLISYRDSANGAIKLAAKGSAGWISDFLVENTSWGGHGTTLLADSHRANATGKIHVLYTDARTHELKYAHEN